MGACDVVACRRDGADDPSNQRAWRIGCAVSAINDDFDAAGQCDAVAPSFVSGTVAFARARDPSAERVTNRASEFAIRDVPPAIPTVAVARPIQAQSVRTISLATCF
jgi:hypothetical protein